MGQKLYTVQSHFIFVPFLLLVAFFNGFAIIFPDDADYLESARNLTPTVWHPVFYGIFIKLTTIDFSLSLLVVPIAQAVIISFLLTETLVALGVSKIIHLILISAAVAFGTCVTLIVGTLQPDIFTPILCLSIFLLCFLWSDLSAPKRIVISVVFILAVTVHLSHIALTIGLVVCIWIIRLFTFGRGWLKSNAGLRLITSLLIISIITILCGNRLLSYHFYLSKTGHAFLINRIAKDQILYKLLSEHCQESRYRLCDYKDFFLNYTSDDYLWQDNRPSPMVALGGWKKTREESYQILADSIRYYPLDHVSAAMRQTSRQFLPLSVDGFGYPIPEKDGSYPAIEKLLGASYERFQNSLQQQGRLIQIINSVSPFWVLSQSMSVLILAICIFRSFRSGRSLETIVVFSLFLMLTLIMNAAVCGILSGESSRYQNRLIWLAALVPMCLIFQKYQSGNNSDM